jgi:hypothetical protein
MEQCGEFEHLAERGSLCGVPGGSISICISPHATAACGIFEEIENSRSERPGITVADSTPPPPEVLLQAAHPHLRADGRNSAGHGFKYSNVDARADWDRVQRERSPLEKVGYMADNAASLYAFLLPHHVWDGTGYEESEIRLVLTHSWHDLTEEKVETSNVNRVRAANERCSRRAGRLDTACKVDDVADGANPIAIFSKPLAKAQFFVALDCEHNVGAAKPSVFFTDRGRITRRRHPSFQEFFVPVAECAVGVEYAKHARVKSLERPCQENAFDDHGAETNRLMKCPEVNSGAFVVQVIKADAIAGFMSNDSQKAPQTAPNNRLPLMQGQNLNLMNPSSAEFALKFG